jgi:hypothetical protein
LSTVEQRSGANPNPDPNPNSILKSAASKRLSKYQTPAPTRASAYKAFSDSFGSSFVVLASSPKRRFIKKKGAPPETVEQKKEREKEERRQDALKRLLARRERRQEQLDQQRKQRRKLNKLIKTAESAYAGSSSPQDKSERRLVKGWDTEHASADGHLRPQPPSSTAHSRSQSPKRLRVAPADQRPVGKGRNSQPLREPADSDQSGDDGSVSGAEDGFVGDTDSDSDTAFGPSPANGTIANSAKEILREAEAVAVRAAEKAPQLAKSAAVAAASANAAAAAAVESRKKRSGEDLPDSAEAGASSGEGDVDDGTEDEDEGEEQAQAQKGPIGVNLDYVCGAQAAIDKSAGLISTRPELYNGGTAGDWAAQPAALSELDSRSAMSQEAVLLSPDRKRMVQPPSLNPPAPPTGGFSIPLMEMSAIQVDLWIYGFMALTSFRFHSSCLVWPLFYFSGPFASALLWFLSLSLSLSLSLFLSLLYL